jgi:hypothetical protein
MPDRSSPATETAYIPANSFEFVSAHLPHAPRWPITLKRQTYQIT